MRAHTLLLLVPLLASAALFPGKAKQVATPSGGATASVPALGYSTYVSRSAADAARGIAVGQDGSLYVTGLAAPTRPSHSHGEAFVAHISSDGFTILYMVYLGGSDDTEAHALAVDAAGNAYVTGQTHAADFPVHNALQPRCSLDAARNCSGDAFLTKLNPDGSIAFSTYLGGSGGDGANSIALDAAGSIYIAGWTSSTDFPVFKPVQATTGGGTDAFVAKVAGDGSRIVFATYLGGKGTDEARGIAVDASGSIYITGLSHSFDFPTAKPLQASCRLDTKNQCLGEAFVTKLTPDGSSFVYSTYLGGSGGDVGNAIAVDTSGNAYVTGETLSADFPLANSLQATSRGSTEAFVSKLAPDGSSLSYSTYLGGSGDDRGYGVTVDGTGNAFVVGRTNSSDFPLKDAVQATCKKDANGACTQDTFVAVLDPTGSTLEFATYLGGSGADEGRGITVDARGAVYLAGGTTSTDFPSAKPAQLPKSSLGNQSVSVASSSSLINTTAGGAFVAQIIGLSVVGGKVTRPPSRLPSQLARAAPRTG